MANSIISDATRRNWNRLGTNAGNKLMSRANKRLSSKLILPIEYFSNIANAKSIQEFVKIVLSNHWEIEDVILSVAINLLKRKNIYERKHVQKVIHSIDAKEIPDIENCQLPSDEMDVLGLVYQSLMFEGDKNQKGSYYTPYSITSKMTSDLDFSKGQTFYDPCCGSGAFILSLNGVEPNNVYASDNDPVAVMMTKFNMLLKFSSYEFEPNVFLVDYLQDGLFVDENRIPSGGFSYIISNPPWGAMVVNNSLSSIITSKESFSYFYVKAFEQLRPGGYVKFLLPESVLNVKCHRDLRCFMLSHGNLKAISLYSGSFTGVQTRYVDVCQENNSQTNNVEVHANGKVRFVDKKSFYDTEGLIFNLLDSDDVSIINKVKEHGAYSLKGSRWALGIVTGDNKGKLKEIHLHGTEPIYTGKEIESYKLKTPKNYIKYDRESFQQVARDEYYRADEKLVYKFISKRLVFAYDNKGCLFLNSANILIPNVPGMSIKTVMAFLNSELFQYVYMSMFGELKVLKSNLEELTFPSLTSKQDSDISSMIDNILTGNSGVEKEMQKYIYNLYCIDDNEIKYINKMLYGKTN